MSKKLLLIFSLFILTACQFQPKTTTLTPTSTPTVTDMTTNSNKITGTITEARSDCAFDGICSFKVDDTWVEVVRGGMLPPDMPKDIQGQIIGNLPLGDESLNRRVEVYGQRTDDGGLTIYGSTDYYIKELQ